MFAPGSDVPGSGKKGGVLVGGVAWSDGSLWYGCCLCYRVLSGRRRASVRSSTRLAAFAPVAAAPLLPLVDSRVLWRGLVITVLRVLLRLVGM